MDEDNFSKKSKSLNQSRNDIEISDDENEEVELTPTETIVWDCTEVISLNHIQIQTIADFWSSHARYISNLHRICGQ